MIYNPVADPGFSPGGAPTPKIAIIFHIFAENCMKMKEFGPPGGRASLAPPLGSANAICIFTGPYYWRMTREGERVDQNLRNVSSNWFGTFQKRAYLTGQSS